MENQVAEIDVFSNHLSKPKMFCKPRTLLSSLFVLLTQGVKLLPNILRQTSKIYLEWSFNWCRFSCSFTRKECWTIYVFATGVGYKIRSVGSTELKNVPYLSYRATCTINVSVKETSMLRLKIWMISLLKESKYIT